MKWYSFAGIGALVLIAGALMGMEGGKKLLKGTWYDGAGLYDIVPGETECRVDSGGGVVWQMVQMVDNPMFEASKKNKMTLQLAFPSLPPVGRRIYFPNDSVQVCYREAGQLLLFETFQATGWVELAKIDAKQRLFGKMELNLVNPHHNFSNSDFQFLGGNFRLQPQRLGEE